MKNIVNSLLITLCFSIFSFSDTCTTDVIFKKVSKFLPDTIGTVQKKWEHNYTIPVFTICNKQIESKINDSISTFFKRHISTKGDFYFTPFIKFKSTNYVCILFEYTYQQRKMPSIESGSGSWLIDLKDGIFLNLKMTLSNVSDTSKIKDIVMKRAEILLSKNVENGCGQMKFSQKMYFDKDSIYFFEFFPSHTFDRCEFIIPIPINEIETFFLNSFIYSLKKKQFDETKGINQKKLASEQLKQLNSDYCLQPFKKELIIMHDTLLAIYKTKAYSQIPNECFDRIKISELLFNEKVSSENVEKYNNIAFVLGFITKGYCNSILILKEVINAVPTRTVAYLNLADAYWGIDNKTSAKEAYQTYANLMKKEGKEKKIPSRVYERTKQ